MYQRDYALDAIMERMKDEKYLLMSSDMDEIPRKETIEEIKKIYDDMNEGVVLDMVHFYFNFKWTKSSRWQKSLVFNDKILNEKKKELSKNEKLSLHELRIIGKFIVMNNGGWHCSYCMPVEKLKHKLDHDHHTRDYNITEDIIRANIKEGKELPISNSGEKLRKYDGKKGLPLIHSPDYYFLFGNISY